jgi:hypothetical protein
MKEIKCKERVMLEDGMLNIHVNGLNQVYLVKVEQSN